MSTVEKIYHRYKLPVFRYLYRMGGDYYLAEDLTLETFYRAYISLKNFRGDSALSTWLFRIAFFVYTGHLSGYPRERHLPIEQEIPDGRRASSPACALEDKENWHYVRLALQQLPISYRTVIVLRELEGLNFEEIGAVLGKAPSTARVTLCRAKHKFRQLYNQLADS